jgi:hypothetical protein
MLMRFVVALLIAPGLDAQAPRMMSCEIGGPDALRSAPPGVARRPKDTLRVPWKNGTAIFADSGPISGVTDGVEFHYCGYDAAAGVHLIARLDQMESGGVLLNQATGRLQPGGHHVLFSDDGSRYLAVFQTDGMEAENWYIYARDGRLLWKGTSGINAVDPELKIQMTYGRLDDPHWVASNELRATIHCFTRAPNGTAMLIEKDGVYAWRTVASCPKGRTLEVPIWNLKQEGEIRRLPALRGSALLDR